MMQVALGVPLDPNRRALFRAPPVVLAHVRIGVGRAAVVEGPGKARMRDVDRQYALLAFVLPAPTGTIHHPQERWFHPGHSAHAEGWRNKCLMLQGDIGDGDTIGLT